MGAKVSDSSEFSRDIIYFMELSERSLMYWNSQDTHPCIVLQWWKHIVGSRQTKRDQLNKLRHKQSLSYHRVIPDCRAFWTIIVLSIIELQQITGLFAIPPLFSSANLNGDAFTLKCHGIVWTEMHLP